jgi:hypothetical protein
MANNKIIVDGKSFRIHPIYDMYGSSEDGFVVHVKKLKPLIGIRNFAGYLWISVRSKGSATRKKLSTARFVWECYNNVIEDKNTSIVHANGKKEDNRLCNLVEMARPESREEAARDDHYRIMRNFLSRWEYVNAVNCDDNTSSFLSLRGVSEFLGISEDLVRADCEGRGCESRISKVDGCRYKFSDATEEVLSLYA